MNEVVHTRRSTATAALVGLQAALAAGTAAWPVQEPAYSTTQDIPSFSFFEETLTLDTPRTSQDFAREIASVFADLSNGQEPLGREFEAVWDANVDQLYES